MNGDSKHKQNEKKIIFNSKLPYNIHRKTVLILGSLKVKWLQYIAEEIVLSGAV